MSGPGVDLKSQAMGLAVSLELPLVVLDVQRGGPSTGLPTKTEQADLLLAMYGRHGEAPLPVIAALSPVDCFYAAMEAMKIAVKWMTPVILLTDGYLGNGSEPFLIPDPSKLPKIDVKYQTQPNYEGKYMPYLRDDKLIRPWTIPGTPGLEHRIGGLEKDSMSGMVSYDGMNHERMVKTRAQKIQNVIEDVPDVETFGAPSGDLPASRRGRGARRDTSGWARSPLRSTTTTGAAARTGWCASRARRWSRTSSSPGMWSRTCTWRLRSAMRACSRTSRRWMPPAVRDTSRRVLRALHRATCEPPAAYRTTWPFRDFSRAHARLMTPGVAERLSFALLPISWRFPRGSRVRLAIAGTDSDHFAQVPHGRPPKLTVTLGGAEGSFLEVPARWMPA